MYRLVNPLGEVIPAQMPFCMGEKVYLIGPNHIYLEQAKCLAGDTNYALSDEEYLGPQMLGDMDYGTVTVLDEGFGVFKITKELQTNPN